MNDKHITLWVQGDSDLSHGTSYVDKEKKDNTQTHFNHIFEERSKGKNLLQKGNLQLFRIKKNGSESYVIQACYEEKDILGRRIAFMSLITGVQNIDEAVDLLEDSSKSIGRTCSPDDIRKIKEAGRKHIKKRFIVLAILVLIIIIVIILCQNNLVKK